MSQTIDQLIAPTGVNHASMLAFMSSQTTHVSIDLLNAFDDWVAEARANGESVDEDIVDSVQHDLQKHHRLTPETLINAPHAPYISLDHTEEEHFAV